jgi:cyanophycinase
MIRFTAGLVLLFATAAQFGCSASGDSASGDSAPDFIESAATQARVSLGSWQSFQIEARGSRTLRANLQPGTAITLAWTDHYGYRAQDLRPRCALDVSVRGAGTDLVATTHNSSRDANGVEPDPVSFVVPASGQVEIRVREVEGFPDNFYLRMESRGVQQPGTPPTGPTVPALKPPSALGVYSAGNMAGDANPITVGALLLAGGGTDNDGAMQAFVNAAGRGDVVVLRMDDTGGAYASYFASLGASSARELVFDNLHGNDDVAGADLPSLRTLADDAWVEDVIGHAEAVFFAGGNQSKYVDVYRNTRLARAIDALINVRHGAVGGTSAGMHVLGGLVHTPRGGGNSVTSDLALQDPYLGRGEVSGTAALECEPSPLRAGVFANVITDTHWSQRNRLGRSLAFLARALTDKLVPLGELRLVAADEGAAVLLMPDGKGRVFGPSSGDRGAYFFKPDTLPARCADNRTLDWPAGVPMTKVAGTLDGKNTFDFNRWQSNDVASTRVLVKDGVVTK